MSKTIFRYSDLVQRWYDSPSEELPHYCHFQIFADTLHPDKPLAEIITNATGYGLWTYNAKRNEYNQILGTCQYVLPKTSRALRQRLKKCALETLQNLDARGLLTDDECQIMTILEKDCERKQRQ
jgi:hypothetical protein